MATDTAAESRIIETKIPARLDRLPWARWHWMVLIGLGTVWILDGLEVTIVGTISSRLTEKGSGISINEAQIGQAAALYVAGACVGALFFGWLADRLGRKKLFLITLALYLVATIATAFSTTFLMFAICRFFTGAGIGGEYAAINSAIDELIPARLRGTVDLIINGSFWLGTAAGAALSIILLNDNIFAADVGWRLAFGLGAVLGVGILLVRRHVPESPRWMFVHGRVDDAEKLVDGIEEEVKESAGVDELKEPKRSIKVREQESVGFIEIAKTVFGAYPRRTVVGLSLFIGQAFLYNAVFFTYALVLGTFYDVKPASVGWYIIPFALGNFAGPLVLGRLFDSVGRKPMISGTYILSGALLIITAFLFKADVWTATSQTAAWSVIFFFASAGASSAYLTVSEIFPMETRALAIAFFYAVGTAIGGITGPLLFGKLVESGKESHVFWGYILGAGLMIAAGIVQAVLGIEAAKKNLEDVATPLSAEEAEGRVQAGLGSPVLLLRVPVLLNTRAGRGHRRGGRGDRHRAARRRRAQPRRAGAARELPPVGPGPLPPRAGGGDAARRDPRHTAAELRGELERQLRVEGNGNCALRKRPGVPWRPARRISATSTPDQRSRSHLCVVETHFCDRDANPQPRGRTYSSPGRVSATARPPRPSRAQKLAAPHPNLPLNAPSPLNPSGACAEPAHACRPARPRARRCPAGGGGPARAGGRCGRAPARGSRGGGTRRDCARATRCGARRGPPRPRAAP